MAPRLVIVLLAALTVTASAQTHSCAQYLSDTECSAYPFSMALMGCQPVSAWRFGELTIKAIRVNNNGASYSFFLNEQCIGTPTETFFADICYTEFAGLVIGGSVKCSTVTIPVSPTSSPFPTYVPTLPTGAEGTSTNLNMAPSGPLQVGLIILGVAWAAVMFILLIGASLCARKVKRAPHVPDAEAPHKVPLDAVLLDDIKVPVTSAKSPSASPPSRRVGWFELVVSLCFWSGFMLALVAYGLGARVTADCLQSMRSGYFGLLVFAIIVMVVSYALNLSFLCRGYTMRALRSLVTAGSAADIIKRARDTSPVFRYSVKCYHWRGMADEPHACNDNMCQETFHDHRHQRGEHLYAQDDRYIEVTHFESEEFRFPAQVDTTDEYTGNPDAPIVKLYINTQLLFADGASEQAYAAARNLFYVRNAGRDVYMEMHEEKVVPGIPRSIIALRDPIRRPRLLRPSVYAIANIFVVGYLYSAWLEHNSCGAHVTVVKTVSINPPAYGK